MQLSLNVAAHFIAIFIERLRKRTFGVLKEGPGMFVDANKVSSNSA